MAMTPESRKRARQERMAQGLCSEAGCPNQQAAGKKKCQRHLDMDAETARKRNHKSIAAGFCSRCKKRPPVEGRKYCQICTDDCVERTKANYKKDPSKQKVRAKQWRQKKLAGG
jgi:hypothetical protein